MDYEKTIIWIGIPLSIGIFSGGQKNKKVQEKGSEDFSQLISYGLTEEKAARIFAIYGIAAIWIVSIFLSVIAVIANFSVKEPAE